MNRRKNWSTYAAPLVFGLAFGLGYVFLQQALLGALAVLMLLELFTGYLLLKQRQLIEHQHKLVMDGVQMTLDLATQLSCATQNLQRACAELNDAGIEFQLLQPAAPSKEELT